MYKTYLTNGKQLSFNKPQVMAIINLTPDSFFDGGKLTTINQLIEEASVKIRQGATILDIGAVSSKPNAQHVSVEDEIKRLQEPLIEIRKAFPHVFLSVDTFSSKVAELAISLGVDIINDISGGTADSRMIDIISESNVAYVLMHMQGNPQTMQINPHYTHVVNDINLFFTKQVLAFKNKGFDKLMLDVGFGFGKTTEHNYQILKNLKEFEIHDLPLLVGMSRKSMINKVIHTMPNEALNGTTVLNVLALQNGASILRVHDVLEAQQCIDLIDFYNKI